MFAYANAKVDFRLARIFCVTAPIHLREPAHCDVSGREPVSSQAHLQNLGRLRPIDRDSDSVTYVNTLRSSSRSNRTSDTKISVARNLAWIFCAIRDSRGESSGCRFKTIFSSNTALLSFGVQMYTITRGALSWRENLCFKLACDLHARIFRAEIGYLSAGI